MMIQEGEQFGLLLGNLQQIDEREIQKKSVNIEQINEILPIV